jgi:hypothetical protein
MVRRNVRSEANHHPGRGGRDMNDLGTWQERILANKPKPTNADKIRAMTDDDLAKYLAWLEDPQACYVWELYGDTDRITEWLDWLKEEVE